MVRLLILLVVLAGAVKICAPSSTTETAKPIDHSPQVQAQREKLLKDLIKQGVFHKFEWSGDIPVVWVAPGFYGLTFEDKQTFVQVAYMYAFQTTASRNILLVRDNLSGKHIASFESQFGLQMK